MLKFSVSHMDTIHTIGDHNRLNYNDNKVIFPLFRLIRCVLRGQLLRRVSTITLAYHIRTNQSEYQPSSVFYLSNEKIQPSAGNNNTSTSSKFRMAYG